MAVLVTAAADVLRLWSKQPGFSLDLAAAGLGPAVGPLTFDVRPGDSFAARAQRVEQQLSEPPRPLPEAPATEPAAEPTTEPSALTCTFAERDGVLTVTWDVQAAQFPAGFPADLVAVCADLLDLLAREPGAWDAPGRLAALPRWQTAERAAANDTAADLPAATLCGLVEARTAESPDAIAVLADDGELTYAETLTSARRLARRLIGLGATPGQLVGVVVDKCLAQVPSVLGVTLSRAAYLPIDPSWPAARRAQLVDQGGVRIIVTTPHLRDTSAWPAGVTLVTLEDSEVLEAPDGPLETAPTPDDLAYVIFTSGSTGRPKGVVVDHRGAANTVQDINERFGVGPADRVLALSSLSFDLSVYDVFGTLAAGAAVVLPAPARAHDPEHWSQLVDRHGVTVWNSVPALLRLWLDSPAPVPAGAPLRLVMLSGDWIPVSLPDELRVPYPDARVISLGGATEASIWSVHYPVGEVPAEWNRIPYGKPLANQTLHVLDHHLDPCPVWTTGEIYIGGIGVAKGYWADPTRTAERFVVHPATGETLYRTGDLGRYLSGGDIEFLGREDSQVKVNGFRIELDEISAVLRRQSGVREAILTVATNPDSGRGQLVAYVVPEDGATAPVAASPGASPDTAAGTSAGTSAWPAALDAAHTELHRAASELAPDIASFRSTWHGLEGLAPTVMARTFARLGFFTAAGSTATVDEIVAGGKVLPLYRGLISQWAAVLADLGVLRATGRPDEYRADGALDADALGREIDAVLAGITAAGPDRTLLDYFTSCIERQLPLLHGETRPLNLLLPDGDWRVTEALYAANPAARLQNRIAAQAVRAFAEDFPADRTVRVLEIGAGTGSTADAVLAALPADRVAYRFTDLSTAFTERARKRYEGVHPFVEYGLFDIDADPAGQGLPAGGVDVVVAANVLHDAKHLTRTLRHTRGLLAPGGLLVLIEGTVNSPLNMISFAFLEGFGNYQDQREATLLSVPQWREQLTAAGFTRFAPVPEGEPVVDALVQHVLLAGTPGQEGVADAALDVSSLGRALAGLLPDYMVPHHFLVLDEVPLSANGKVDRSALPSPWTEPEPQERTEPLSELERRLHEIWCDALGHSGFGTEDNFFDLGGDSLHAVRIAGRLRAELGIDKAGDEAIDMLFQAPTIKELALALSLEAGTAA
ncbi:amino acid adenylation domain-containing protein [Streptomyces sp. G1]|uniref:amino acid adenylation domain-containing protein n=1 Tax=Streptomyces sp. G1 TaxID=361572 RepID=UPI002030586D|nr:amino acid adenylation domain-containing protein [Streptomyces sp. G1]MCM1969373.1 amino acid adenylation domain-containing protein [Streptomyces sp. G1]